MNPTPDKAQARQSGAKSAARLAPPTAAELVNSPPPDHADARFVRAEGTQEAVPNAAFRAVIEWLEAITAAGGTPADLDRAWSIWTPAALPGENYPRRLARRRFDELKARAWRQTYMTPQRPEGLRHMEAVAHARWLLEQAQANLVPVEAKYLAFKAEVDRAQARLAAAEAAADGR
jgi:hypothetical protein